MMRRREITLGVVLSFSVWLLSSCGGGAAPATTPPTAPSVTLSATSLTFSGQLVGTTSSSQGVTLTNSGNAALSLTSVAITGTNSTDFAQTSTCGTSVAAGANCAISVTFTPMATGSRAASVTITDNASGSPQSISLAGTGTAPAAALSPATVSFSNQLLGTTSSAMTATVSNSGTAALTIASIAISGTNAADFANQASSTCSASSPVAAGGSCNINIAFTPTVNGAESATLTVTDNSGATAGSTQTAALSGTGTEPVAALGPATLSFPTELVGTTSSAMTATVTNSGTGPLTITSIVISGTNSADFTNQASSTCSASSPVAAGGSCNINIAFTPTVNGAESATLTVTDNSDAKAGTTQMETLSGTGTEPVASLSATTLTFPTQLESTSSSAMTVTLSNTGTAPLTIASIVISGTNSADFVNQASSTCSASSPVAAEGSCSINIAFTPSTAAAESATLTITDNSSAVAGSTQVVALSGTGTLTPPTVSGTVTKGAVSGATVTVYAVNSDGSSGAALSSGTDTTDASGNFSVTLTASPSGPVRVSVTGGTYTSEWNNSSVTTSSAVSSFTGANVSALIDSVGGGATGINVTAVSTFVDNNTAGSLKSGKFTSETSAHAAAQALLGGFYGFAAGTTVETLAPAFTSGSIGTDGFKLGLVVGTLTAEGVSLNSTDPDSLIPAMAEDISDGVWDGLAFGAAINLGASDPSLPSTAGTTDFSTYLGTYVASGYSPGANGVNLTNAGSVINGIDTDVATCTCTPPAVGLAATSSGAINSMAFTPSNSTTGHQYLFIAARTSGVVAVDITDPTLTAPPVTVWQQLYLNSPGSGGFGSIEVGGVIPFVGTAGHPQLLALAYNSKHILILNANTLVTGTPWVNNPVDAEMDVPITASLEVEFSGGSAYIGSGVPLGGSILALATADGYMIFDASQVGVAGGNPVLKVYPVQDPTEIIAENLGADPVHHYLLAGNESTCAGFGCNGGVQIVDLSAGDTNGTSYYLTPANFLTDFPGTPTANSVDANSVDPSLQVGILTFEDTPYVQFVNMSNITKTVSTTPGVLDSWAPAAGGGALVELGVTTQPIISGSAVDPTTHLAYFMAGYSTDMAVGQIQNPATVPAGATWQGLSDWSFYDLSSSTSLSYEEATDPHADGVVYNLSKGTPYGYELNGTNLGVVQTDLAGFLNTTVIARAGSSGDAAHQPSLDPTTVKNPATGGYVMQEITWALPLGITTTSPPTGYVGSAYSYSLSAVNGISPYTWSTTSAGNSALSAAGLTLNSAGSITGTPTTVGTVAFTLTVTDSTTPTPLTASAPITIYIDATPPTITTTSLPAATLSSAYSATVTATGGQTPYTWTITGGALPAGITLTTGTPSATISGTPTIPGVAFFTVTVTDSSPVPQSVSQPLSITVNNTTALTVPSTITLPTGTEYAGYNGSLQASFTGGTPPFTCSLASGTLPAGLSFNTSNCAVQGVPTAATTGPVTLGVSVTDSSSSPGTGSTSASLSINTGSNNAELNGQYAFFATGYDASGYATVVAGSFTADGNGNITNGLLDLNDSLAGPTTSLAFTGNYGVGPDNRGGMVISDSQGTFTFLFSVGSVSSTTGIAAKAHFEEFDTSGMNVTGQIALQTPADFLTSALTGNYAFGILGGYDGRLTGGGVFTADGSGNLSAGETDINNDDTIGSALSLTGTYSVPTTGAGTSNGRGTGTLVLATGTLNFAFYVVDNTKLYLVSTDPATSSILASVFAGTAGLETGGPYSDSSLSGISVFSSAALSTLTSTSPSGASVELSDVQVGLLTFDGAGNFTLSSDEANAGISYPNSITGTYSVAANGRVSLSITSGASASYTPPVFYLDANGDGIIVGTDVGVTFGTFTPQTATSFSAASFSGHYFFGTQVGAAAAPGSEIQSGVLYSNGSGSIFGTGDTNTAGQLNPDNSFFPTYSVFSQGEVTVISTSTSVYGTTTKTDYFYVIDSTKSVGIPDASSQTPTLIVVHQ